MLYTSTGISGANFWVPVYLLWLGLDPAVAFWLGLVTMLFGSSSGLLRHARQGTVDYRQAGLYLVAALPAAVAGARLALRLPLAALIAAFGLFALGYAVHLAAGGGAAASPPGRAGDLLASIVGGLGVGAVSVGLGALLLPRCLRRRAGGRQAEAAGTVLVAVFLSSFAAALARLQPALVEEIGRHGGELLGPLVLVLPGVLTGGQIGPRLAYRLDREAMRRYAAVLLAVVGILMLLRAWKS